MPKGFVETDHVNKDVFMQVLKLKKTSIRRLDEELSIECSDKTIRRSLNNGKMRRQYIEQIAKYLDVDSRLLTGELVEGAFPYPLWRHEPGDPAAGTPAECHCSCAVRRQYAAGSRGRCR